VGQLEDPKKIIGVLAVHDPEEEAILAEFRELKAKGDLLPIDAPDFG
jgi:hypothetical protein